MPSVLILAGGTGERFWPVSTAEKPKQFLPLTGNFPMIQETVQRVKDLIGLPKTYVVTTKAQLQLVCEVLPALPAENIIVEPEGRNTAPSLVLSVSYIKRKEGQDEVIAVLPSDHFIGDNIKFQESLKLACTVAETRQEIVTFGIKPDRPETGYGYIAVGQEVDSGVLRGIKFVEKPDYSSAQNYINSGTYLWNSGMFVFRVEVFVEMLRKYSPQLYKSYLEFETAKDCEAIQAIYNQLPKASIDYALMEALPSFLVIPGTYDWDDLGTWRSLETIHPKDQNGNIILGDCELLDVSDSVIYSRDKLVAAIGVKELVIVVSQDGTLICPKDRVREVKQIVERLKSAGQEPK